MTINNCNSLESITVQNSPMLTHFSANKCSNPMGFTLINLNSLKTMVFKNLSDTISTSILECPLMEILTIDSCSSFYSLNPAHCGYVSKNTQLKVTNSFNNISSAIHSYNTGFISYEISHCDSIKQIASNTNHTDIEIAKITYLPGLLNFNLDSMNIKNVVIKQLSSATVFSIIQSKLEALQVKDLPLLQSISVNENLLNSINIQNCPALEHIAAINNSNLACIQIDDQQTINTLVKQVDAQTVISDNCDGRTYKFQGSVYHDKNSNGNKDNKEPYLSGIKVKSSDGRYGYTNKMGEFLISTLDTGNYTITLEPNRIIDCNGSHDDLAIVFSPITQEYQIQIDTNTTIISNLDFGIGINDITQCGTICGHVFNDLNQNGIQDNGELNQQGINIKFSPGGLVSTNQLGNYCVELPQGDQITVNMVPGLQTYGCNEKYNWHQTFPLSPQTYKITLNESTPDLTANFGVYNKMEVERTFDVTPVSIRPGFNNPGQDFVTYMDYKRWGVQDEFCTLNLTFPETVKNKKKSRAAKSQDPTHIEWELSLIHI